MKILFRYVLVMGLFLMGCSSGNQSSLSQTPADNALGRTGDVRIKISEDAAVSGVFVIYVDADDMDSPIEESFERADIAEDLLITGIPIGDDRTIRIEVYTAEGELTHRGVASGISISEGQQTTVEIALTSVVSVQSGNLEIAIELNDAPVILGILLDPAVVMGGDSVHFYLYTIDEQAQSLEINWSSDLGTFSDATASETTWIAPLETSIAEITVVVSDGVSEASVSFVVEVTAEPISYALVINEFLADPSAELSQGDANADGVVGSSDDEFIEIVNLAGESVDLGGLTLSDAGSVRHEFAVGTLLDAGKSIVVFGGGSISTDLSFQTELASSGSLSLNNSADTITLSNPSGVAIDVLSYGAEAGDDMSLSRNPDLTGDFVGHREINEYYHSAGLRIDRSEF
jgi:hypothetical protein